MLSAGTQERTRQSIAYRNWFFRLFCWDGALPASVFLAPFMAKRVFPNNPGIIELLAIMLPIAALMSRFVAGSRVIRSNHCGEICRVLQFLTFGIALVILLLTDTVLMLKHNMPAGALFAKGDHVVWACFAATYLTSMVFAMYPGRSPNPSLP